MRAKNKKPVKKPLLLAAIAVLAAALLLFILEKTNTTNLIHKPRPKAQTTTEDTKGEVGPGSLNSQNSSTNQNNGTDDKGSTGTQPAQGEAPKSPSGDFVSNYKPNLSGHPTPNLLASVCNTTPGATCAISFIKDDVTKSLAGATADRGGAVYWTWKLQDLGLTTGSWKIRATATLNNKTATIDSPLTLDVQP